MKHPVDNYTQNSKLKTLKIPVGTFNHSKF